MPSVFVATSQIVAARRAFLDIGRHGARMSDEHYFATMTRHGIPASALAIALIIGTSDSIVNLASVVLRLNDLAVSVALLGQVYFAATVVRHSVPGTILSPPYRRGVNLD